MKNRKIDMFILILILLSSSLFIHPRTKKNIKELPLKYRKWLEEEVVYIITPKEKEVFLQLETDRERELFIKAFWKQRDPTPGTPENEFKEEHYRRIRYANLWFGRGTPTPGWKTDMGRIYIILGEPKSIERYENLTQIYPTIVWFYQGMSKYGLPDAFYVVFFKKYGAGDYELYSPIKDGPQSLLVHYLGDPADYLSAYRQLESIQPQLAKVSLSLIPGESMPTLAPSIASEILLSNIEVKPQKAIKDLYAEKLLKYKDIVEVEYTANYIDNDNLVTIIRDNSGICYVHYLIEPKRLSVNFFSNKYYTTLEISGKLSDLKGRTIYQFTKYIDIKFDEKQRKKIQNLPFCFQDMFPLVEGNYKFNLLVKNTVSKEFTSIEKDLIVPSFKSPVEMTSLILAHHIKKIPQTFKNKPFKIEDIQIYPSPRNDFTKKDKLFIFFQIPNITPELTERGIVLFEFFKDKQEFLKIEKEIKSYPQKGKFLEEISLENFPPGRYKLKVSILSPEKKEILVEQTFFSVSPVDYIPRPFIYSELSPPSNSPLIYYIIGGQYFNQKKYEKAKFYLEKAYKLKPNNLKFAEGLCRILIIFKEYEKAKKILFPFTKTKQKDLNFYKTLGQICQKLKQYEEAIKYFEKYLSYYGTNLEVLNSIGHCYLAMGKRDEAIKVWEKSLQLEPNQKHIQKLIASIKGKK